MGMISLMKQLRMVQKLQLSKILENQVKKKLK